MMKKTITIYSAAVILALSLLMLTSSVSAQKGCGLGANEFLYDDGSVYWFQKIDNQWQPIDRAVTSDRLLSGSGTFLFEARPRSVQVQRGQKIYFDPSLDRSQTGELYALYYRAATGNDNKPQYDPDDFMLPFTGQMPSAGATVTAKLRPYNYYYNDGAMIIRSGSVTSEDGRIKSEVSITGLTSDGIDTTNMAEGFYWFTLQGMSVRNSEQNPDGCAKTTAPVLIEVVKPKPPPPPNNAPTVNLRVDGAGCSQRTITAVVEDIDNLPNSGVQPQNLTLTWEILGSGQPLVRKSLGAVASYTETISTRDLPPGEYTVEVKASDGELSAFVRQPFNLSCAGAGIVYFQFDEPYRTRRNLSEPEDWLRNYGRRNQCESGSMPSTEFGLFYDLTGISRPASRKSNREKLDAIVAILNSQGNLKLHIAGYADFRANFAYNTDLVDRRINVVRQYLISRGIDVGRLTDEKAQNFADGKAQSCVRSSCDDSRRHDRRVELIYYNTNEQPPLPRYDDSPCPVNANLLINPLYENDFEIMAEE